MEGTLIDENISRAAGAEPGQAVTALDFERVVEPLGRNLVQANHPVRKGARWRRQARDHEKGSPTIPVLSVN